MNRVRRVLATLLLAGFASVAVLVLVGSLIVLGSIDGGSLVGALFDAFAFGLAAVAVAVIVPAGVALALRPRHPVASGVVASLLGVVVMGVSTAYDMSPLAGLAGLALVVCALPLPVGRVGGDYR